MLGLQSVSAIPALLGILGSHLFHKRCIWVFTAYKIYATQLVGWWIEQSLPGGECHFLRKQACIPSTQEIIQCADCRWGGGALKIADRTPTFSAPLKVHLVHIGSPHFGEQRAAFSLEHCFHLIREHTSVRLGRTWLVVRFWPSPATQQLGSLGRILGKPVFSSLQWRIWSRMSQRLDSGLPTWI